MHLLLKSLILFILPFSVIAEEFLPSNIYQLDSRFAHHVIVVEKSTHKLYVFENSDSRPKLIKTYRIATGKISGDKQVQGDEKTPEGVYIFKKFRPAKELLASYGDYALIYGAGAFTTNYPNVMDVRAGKTGGGIWLHSANDDSRVDKRFVSRGCVVAMDADLKEVSNYIDLGNTPVVIVQNLQYLNKDTWIKNREKISSVVHTWATSWKEKNFNEYISQYSRNEFFNPRKGNFSQYKRYKKAIFSRTETPEISFSNISILSHQEYAVVTLEQDYTSKLIQDVGKKILYLKKDENYNWKIVAEQWHKLEQKQYMAFVPSPRFFNENQEALVQSQERKTSNIKEN